uniref:Si:dkey-70p6.1 n=1 Tax=Oryzias sinensis TaxID=183150 RepID=A0A8C8DYV0_9TELE
MASMQDGLNFTAPPYGKVLLLGAIAAASAFVVTILIVVLCVGCQRKGKAHNVPGESGKHRLMDMQGILKQSKLRSISKSDTEMNKMNCNGKRVLFSLHAKIEYAIVQEDFCNLRWRG